VEVKTFAGLTDEFIGMTADGRHFGLVVSVLKTVLFVRAVTAIPDPITLVDQVQTLAARLAAELSGRVAEGMAVLFIAVIAAVVFAIADELQKNTVFVSTPELNWLTLSTDTPYGTNE